jgi:hypothetical protein
VAVLVEVAGAVGATLTEAAESEGVAGDLTTVLEEVVVLLEGAVAAGAGDGLCAPDAFAPFGVMIMPPSSYFCCADRVNTVANSADVPHAIHLGEVFIRSFQFRLRPAPAHPAPFVSWSARVRYRPGNRGTVHGYIWSEVEKSPPAPTGHL